MHSRFVLFAQEVAGELIVALTESIDDRDLALRMPWLVAAALQVVLFFFAAPVSPPRRSKRLVQSPEPVDSRRSLRTRRRETWDF